MLFVVFKQIVLSLQDIKMAKTAGVVSMAPLMTGQLLEALQAGTL